MKRNKLGFWLDRSARLFFLVVFFAGLCLNSFATPLKVKAAGFTAGNLAVYRVGSGTGSLVSTGNPVFVDEYAPDGTLVQSLALPTTASGSSKQLIAGGTATSEGLLTRSANGQYLVLTGYARDLGGTGSLSGTAASTVNRTIGRVDVSGNIDTSTALSDYADGNNPRSAVSDDGSTFWGLGGAGGVRYAALGSSTSTPLATSPANIRQVNIFNGQLYFSTGSGTTGIYSVGTGLPTTSGQTATILPGATSGSPYAFYLTHLGSTGTAPDTLYLADDAAGIKKYSLISGAWTLNNTVGTGTDSYRGLTGVTSGTTVTLYATRKGGGAAGGGELVKLVDATGYNVSITASPTLLATAAANTAFRGVAFAPVSTAPTAPTITAGPQDVTIPNNTSTTLSVTATGTAPLHYQWYQSGTAGNTTTPVGTDSASFNTGNLTTTTAYWVRVSNTVGTADSGVAIVTVSNAALSITTQPQSQSIVSGTSATLTVAASGGSGTRHYQWYQGNTPGNTGTSTAVGSDSASFNTGVLTSNTSYWVRVTDDTTSVDSQRADITVTAGTRIHDIQGAAHISPLVATVLDVGISNGQSVSNVPGIVTALRNNGFYMQDATPDSNDATSEGIFVFTGSATTGVAVGDAVAVSGTVQEFRPSCTSSASCNTSSSAYNNLTTTEIGSNPTINISAHNQTLPAPIVIGTGGRVPPTQKIETVPPSGSVETSGNSFDVTNDGIDFWESLEGMRVQLANPVAVGPTKLFGSATPASCTTSGDNCEIAVVPGNFPTAGLRTARGGIEISSADYNPERIILNNILNPNAPSAMPNVNVGDSFSGTVTGVIDYTFANYKLFPTETLPAVTPGGTARETNNFNAPLSNQLNVATFNVENLAPGDPASKYSSLASYIITNLKKPDIIAVEEIQDNNGATDNGVVAADQSWGALISAISMAGGPTYQYREIDPQNDLDGGQPGGNIRQGFLFRTDRGLAFVDRPGATSTTANTVQNVSGKPQLQYSPGRIDPTNADGAFTSSRKPLAGQFTFNGQTLFVIANHFNSKGGDQPLYGRFQPPTLSSEAQRIKQATVVHNFVNSILDIDPNANVVVAGDLNDFQFSNPVNILKNNATPTRQLHALIETLPANEQYTYVYEGNSQAIDHILISNNLFNNSNVQYDVVHVNSEFYDQVSDHDPVLAQFSLPATVAAVDDSYSLTAGTTIMTTAANGVLANDTGGASTVVSHTDPAHGTLTLNNDGSFSYTPATGFTGTDSFVYTTTNSVQLYTTNLPPLANNVGGVNITAGAYGSALTPVPGTTDQYYGLTDRGPNVDGPNGSKVEPIPSFTPAIGKFKFENGKAVLIGAPITLKAADGTSYNGQVNTEANTGETITDLNGNTLPTSPNGYDSEGLVALADGTFWVSDEYGPFVTHFDATGKQTARLSPYDGSLPAELKFRVPNRGMEGLTITPDGSTLVGIMQSALQQPDYGSADPKKNTLLRIVTYQLAAPNAVHEYIYLLDNPNTNKTAVSEIAAVTSTTFLVDERDGDFLSAAHPSAYKKLWLIDISGATDVGPAASISGATYDGPNGGLLINGSPNKTLDLLVLGQDTATSKATLAAKGITVASKSLYLDIGNMLTRLDPQWRFFSHDKIEGVAVLNDGSKIVISNDSDFGIDGLTNNTSPFTLHAKTSPTTGKQDDGEYLVIDMTAQPANTSSATVTFTVNACDPLTVTSATDDGTGATCGTLSAAIDAAKTASNNNDVTITLAVPTITLTGSSLQTISGISHRVTVGADCTTIAGTPASRVQILAGSGGSVPTTGLTLGSNATLQGVSVTGFTTSGIKVIGAHNTIACSWIGTANGTSASPNGIGIDLQGTSSDTNLGVSGQTNSGNVISGNTGNGIYVEAGSANNHTYYNLVGYASDGTTVLRNGGPAIKIDAGGKLIFNPGNRVHA